MKQLQIDKSHLPAAFGLRRRKRAPEGCPYSRTLSVEERSACKRVKSLHARSPCYLTQHARVRLKRLSAPLADFEPPTTSSLKPFRYSFHLEREVIKQEHVQAVSPPLGATQNDDPMDVDETFDTPKDQRKKQGVAAKARYHDVSNKIPLQELRRTKDTDSSEAETREVSTAVPAVINPEVAKVVQVCQGQLRFTRIIATNSTSSEQLRPQETVEVVQAILSLKNAEYVQPLSCSRASSDVLTKASVAADKQSSIEPEPEDVEECKTTDCSESCEEKHTENEVPQGEPDEVDEIGAGVSTAKEDVSKSEEFEQVKTKCCDDEEVSDAPTKIPAAHAEEATCEVSVQTDKPDKLSVSTDDTKTKLDFLRSLKSLEDFPPLQKLVEEKVKAACSTVLSQSTDLTAKVKELEQTMRDSHERNLDNEQALREEVKTLRSSLDRMESMHSLTLKESGSLERTVKELTRQLANSQHKSAELAEMTRLSICRVAGAENEAFRLQKSLQDEHSRRKLLFQQTINFRGKLLECINETARTFRHVEERIAHVQQKLDHAEMLREEAGKRLTEHLKIKQKRKAAQRQRCVICFTAPTELVLVPCGHKSLCSKCGTKVKGCPICRQDIRLRVKTYDTGYSELKP